VEYVLFVNTDDYCCVIPVEIRRVLCCVWGLLTIMDTLHKAQLNTFDISVIQLQFALLNRCLCYLRPEHTDK